MTLRSAWSFGLTLAIVVLVAGVPQTASADPGWSGSGGGWSGQGSVFLPGGQQVGGPANGDDGSGCGSACQWWIVPMCDLAGEFSCEALGACATKGQRRYFVYYQGPGALDGVLQAAYCAVPGQRPVSTREVGQWVGQQIRDRAPKLRIGLQPRGGAVTQLPTIFRTGQPTSFQRSDSLAGVSVRFKAAARWRWTWGDGSHTDTTRPGGRWPDMSLTHTYRTDGNAGVGVRADWDAQFWVAGAGPFTVGGEPVVQHAQRTIKVRQARAVLVADD
ncbi:MAG: hypothetical protein ACOYD0_02635 [Candidatus Nanopelagicales bacterium]